MVQYDNHWPEHLRVAFHVLPIVAAVGALELRLFTDATKRKLPLYPLLDVQVRNVYGYDADETTIIQTFEESQGPLLTVPNGINPARNLRGDLDAVNSDTSRVEEFSQRVINSFSMSGDTGCVRCSTCQVQPTQSSPERRKSSGKAHKAKQKGIPRKGKTADKRSKQLLFQCRMQAAQKKRENRLRAGKRSEPMQLVRDTEAEEHFDQSFTSEERRLVRTLTEYVAGKSFFDLSRSDLNTERLFKYVTTLYLSYVDCLNNDRATYGLLKPKRVDKIKELIKCMVPYERQREALRKTRMGQGMIKNKSDLQALFDSILRLNSTNWSDTTDGCANIFLTQMEYDEGGTASSITTSSTTTTGDGTYTMTIPSTPAADTTTATTGDDTVGDGTHAMTNPPAPAAADTTTATTSDDTAGDDTTGDDTAGDGTHAMTIPSTPAAATDTTTTTTNGGIFGVFSNMVGTITNVFMTSTTQNPGPDIREIDIGNIFQSQDFQQLLNYKPSRPTRARAPNWNDETSNKLNQLLDLCRSQNIASPTPVQLSALLYLLHRLGPYERRTVARHMPKYDTGSNDDNNNDDDNDDDNSDDNNGVDDNHTNNIGTVGSSKRDDGAQMEVSDDDDPSVDTTQTQSVTPPLQNTNRSQEALSEIEKLLCWLAVYKHMIYKDNKMNINSWRNVKSTVDEYKCEILDANQKLAIPYAIDKLDVATVSCKYKEFFNAQKKRTRNRNLDGIMWIQDEAFTSSNAFLIRHRHLKDIIEKMRGPILQT